MSTKFSVAIAVVSLISAVIESVPVDPQVVSQSTIFPAPQGWDVIIGGNAGDYRLVVNAWGLMVLHNRATSQLLGVRNSDGKIEWMTESDFLPDGVLGFAVSSLHIVVSSPQSVIVVLGQTGVLTWTYTLDEDNVLDSFISAPVRVLPEIVYVVGTYQDEVTTTFIKIDLAAQSVALSSVNKTGVSSPTIYAVDGTTKFIVQDGANFNAVYVLDAQDTDKIATEICYNENKQLRQQFGGSRVVAASNTLLFGTLTTDVLPTSPGVTVLSINGASCTVSTIAFSSGEFTETTPSWLGLQMANATEGQVTEKVTYLVAVTGRTIAVFDAVAQALVFNASFKSAWFIGSSIPVAALTNLQLISPQRFALAVFDLREMNFTVLHIYADPLVGAPVGQLVTNLPTLTQISDDSQSGMMLTFPTSPTLFTFLSLQTWTEVARYRPSSTPSLALLDALTGSLILLRSAASTTTAGLQQVPLTAVINQYSVAVTDTSKVVTTPVQGRKRDTFYFDWNSTVIALTPQVGEIDVSLRSVMEWEESVSQPIEGAVIDLRDYLFAPTQISVDIFDAKKGEPVKVVFPPSVTPIAAVADDENLYVVSGMSQLYRVDGGSLALEATAKACDGDNSDWCDTYSSPPLVDTDFVYQVSESNRLRAYPKGNFNGAKPLWNTTKFLQNNVAYLNVLYGATTAIQSVIQMCALDGATGETLWDFRINAGSQFEQETIVITPFYDAIYVAALGTVYAMGLGGRVDPQQPMRWVQALPEAMSRFCTPLISPDGILIMFGKARIFAIDTQRKSASNEAVSRQLWSVSATCTSLFGIRLGVLYAACSSIGQSDVGDHGIVALDLYSGRRWLSFPASVAPTKFWIRGSVASDGKSETTTELVFYGASGSSSTASFVAIRVINPLYQPNELPAALPTLQPVTKVSTAWKTGAIAGGTVGGAVVLAAVIGVAIKVYRGFGSVKSSQSESMTTYNSI